MISAFAQIKYYSTEFIHCVRLFCSHENYDSREAVSRKLAVVPTTLDFVITHHRSFTRLTTVCVPT